MKLDIGMGTTQLVTYKMGKGKVIIEMNRLFMPEKIGASHSIRGRNFVIDACALVIHNSKGLEQLESIVSKAREFIEEV